MHIVVQFQFNDEDAPSAVSGVAGQVSDFILPMVGDTVRHQDFGGKTFVGKVTSRLFNYELPPGIGVDGVVTVLIYLDRIAVN